MKKLVEKGTENMLSQSPNLNQTNMLYPNLLDQLNLKDPLIQLAKAIPWKYLEEEFTPLYSHRGKPAKPIRLMVGLCILKHLENLSDDELVMQWVRNPYYQFFCGERDFQVRQESPIDLAGESPVIEGEPIPLCSEPCVIGGNENYEA